MAFRRSFAHGAASDKVSNSRPSRNSPFLVNCASTPRGPWSSNSQRYKCSYDVNSKSSTRRVGVGSFDVGVPSELGNPVIIQPSSGHQHEWAVKILRHA